jgi:hypothetical protein
MKYCKTRQRAIKKGRKYYKTGEPCSNGHYSHRYTSTARCVECDRIYTQNRRDDLKTRTPSWCDVDEIRKVYEKVPVGYSVDHKIPLRGERVSGLHVPDNLVIVPLRDNLSKKNVYHV